MRSSSHHNKHSITRQEIRCAADAIPIGWSEKYYEYTNRIEQAFKAHLGDKYVITTSNCMGHLQIGIDCVVQIDDRRFRS